MSEYPFVNELVNALSRTDIPNFRAGASGYFSKPRATLDPALFDGDRVKDEVTGHILTVLYNFWLKRGFNRPWDWTTVWLAGSGISYQWAGDRGNGDLDVLMGIDWPKFYLCNPKWNHTSIDQTTDFMNNELRQLLWPRTTNTEFGGKTFELTYFVIYSSPDIRDINPYAAYNLSDDVWTVRPPASEDTAYHHKGHPGWQAYADYDLETARAIRQGVLENLKRLDGALPAARVNRMMMIGQYVNQAVQLMTDIHGHRQYAFAPGGHGYWDFNNWRWQMAKKNGVVAVLGALEHAYVAAREAAQATVYGNVFEAPAQMLIRSALASQEDV